MKEDRKQRIALAAKLVTLGKQADAAKAKLRQLVEDGVSYDAEQMLAAYRDCVRKNAQWQALEQQYFLLREQITRKRTPFESNPDLVATERLHEN